MSDYQEKNSFHQKPDPQQDAEPHCGTAAKEKNGSEPLPDTDSKTKHKQAAVQPETRQTEGEGTSGGTQERSAPSPQHTPAAVQFSAGGQAAASKQDNEYTRRMKQSFGFFGPATLLYAAFYAFCMFRNSSGITFPFFVAASLWYMYCCLSKLEITLRKGSGFYMVSLMLLGISTFCTDDGRIIALNKTGIYLLVMSMLLHQVYERKGWELGKQLWGILYLSFGCLGEIGRPFLDCAAYFRERKEQKRTRFWYVMLGILISLPFLAVVTVLLASADLVFRIMAERVMEYIRPVNLIQVCFMVAWMFLAAYLVLSFLCKRDFDEQVRDRRRGEPILAITVSTLLTLIYLLFSGIQILYLFLGRMQLPENYTYAEYAREGFFQLLFVSLLNLVLVLVFGSWFRRSRILNIIMTVMSLCTFVMIASSALRMLIYIKTYYLTFLRLAVLWGLAVLALLFAGVIVHIFRERFPLFRYSMVVVTFLYIAISFAHPDYIIARYNVAHAAAEITPETQSGIREATGFYHDYYYLSYLCADAAPVLVPYLEELGYEMEVFFEGSGRKYWEDVKKEHNVEGRSEYVHSNFGYRYLQRLQGRTEKLSLRTFNISRYRALRYLRRYAP